MRPPPRFLLTSDPLQADAPRPPSSVSTIAINTDVIAILAALLCAFVCVIGLALVARCSCLRRSSSASSAAPHPSPRKGLKKKALRAMPTLSFASSAAASGSVELVDCAICLAEFADGDEVRVLPQCGHGFHAACVDTWLGAHASCPSCRQVLVLPTSRPLCQMCGGSSGGAASGPKKVDCGGASA